MQNYAEILFVNEVRALQEEDGSAQKYESIYPTRTYNTVAGHRDF